MVDVVNRGTKDLATCGNCGSELRWTQSDVRLKKVEINVGPYEIDCMPDPEDTRATSCAQSVTTQYQSA
jgi:hypothetical protein